jgi:hypothetical protein
MKAHLKVALAVFAVIGLGAFIMAGAHAQATPPVLDGTGAHPQAAPPVLDGDSTKREPKVVPKDVSQFTLTWSGGRTAGNCTLLPGATLTVRSDGTATWTAQALSSGDNDSYGIGIFLIDAHNVTLFGFPFIWSPTLARQPRTWIADLFFPAYMFSDIDHATRGNDHC